MVIECVIADGGRVSFDCVKQTLSGGAKMEVPDVLYPHPEIQGALKSGLVRIVGNPPATVSSFAQPIQHRKMRNMGATRLALDCMKTSVIPGECINIPENVYYTQEVQNAIGLGWLQDANAPVVTGQTCNPDELFAAGQNNTATLEEVKVQEPGQKTAQGQGLKRQPMQKQKKSFKAKPISSASGGVEDGTPDGDLSNDELYRETPIWEDKDAKGPVAAQKPSRTRAVEEDPLAEASGLPKLKPGVKPKGVDQHTIDDILGNTEDLGGF